MQIITLTPLANLGIAGVYNSQLLDMTKNAPALVSGVLKVQVLGDQASAANGVKILASKNADFSSPFTVAQAALVANTLLSISTDIAFPYYKVQITNGGTAQTTLLAGGLIA